MVKGNFRLVSEDILREILRKKQVLERNPEYHLHYSNGKKKSLRKESNKHSVSLELEIYDTYTTEGRKRKAREQRRCERNLVSAMDWGLTNYEGDLSQDFIKCLAYKIEPKVNKEGYRKEKVRIVGATWSPPSAEKLDREMNIFLFENSCLDNVIDKATHTHFHIARIHPFLDGNGRVARAIQNIMLEKNGFFPAVVKPSERLEYMHLLDSAVNSYRIVEGNLSQDNLNSLNELYETISKPTTYKEKEYCKSLVLELAKAKMSVEQNDFYNFIALKIRDSLREETDRLYGISRKNK